MDNLRLGESLGAVRYFLCLSACLLLASEWQATAATAADRPQLAQQTESPPPASASIQKIQRLLKLLSDRYPERYGSVDPGRLDGVLGGETKVAIRNFRKITGLTDDPRPDSALTPDILSELAQMTSTDAGSQPATPQPETTSGTQAEPEGKPAVEPAAAEAPQPAAATLAQATKSRDADTAEQPRSNAILYFVQVASLRSVESAEREWQRIKSENRAALEGEQTYLERADLRDRGIFHRILIGPMPNRDDANTLCGYLKQNDQTCVVTQRRAAEINRVDFRKLSSNATGTDKPRLPWEVPAPAETAEPAPLPRLDSATAPVAPPAKPAEETAAVAPISPAPAAPTAKTAVPAAPSTERAAVNETPDPTASVATTPAESAAAAPAVPTPALPAPTAEAPKLPVPAMPAPETPAAKADSGGDAMAKSDKGKVAEPVAAAPAPAAETSPTAKGGDAKKDEKTAATEIRISVDKLQTAAAGSIALAFLLAGGFLVYRVVRRRREQSALIAAATAPAGVPDTSPLSAMETERVGELESLAQLEEAFDSAQLRESRRVRDAFLRDVLEDDPDDPDEIKKRDSAIRVNSNLKMLLASDPGQYKAIFLNLIFLSKVGAALNRRDIALEELNGKFSREFMLLQSYFKIHVLELDDRHRIRQELPGLFYCLQLSQLHQRQGKRHFSAA